MNMRVGSQYYTMFLTDIWVLRTLFRMAEIQGVIECKKPEVEVLTQVSHTPFRLLFANSR